MSSQQILTSAYWNNPGNGQDYLRANTEFVGAYVDEVLENSVISKLFDVKDSNVINETYTTWEANGTVGLVPEGANIPNFEMGKGYKTILSPEKIATKVEMTYEMRMSIKDPERDAAKLLLRQSKIVLSAFRKTLERRAMNYFDNAFTAGYNSQTRQSFVSPDGQALISANHAYQTGGTFSNLLTAQAPSGAVLDELMSLASTTLGADGNPIMVMPKAVVVKQGSATHLEFQRLFAPSTNFQYRTTTISGINIYAGGSFNGIPMDIIATPYLDLTGTGKAYFFISDFEDSTFENPLKFTFQQRPSLYGEFRDGDNASVYQDFLSYSADGIALLPIGIRGVPGTY